MVLFVAGIVLLIGYGVYQGLDEIMATVDVVVGFLIGVLVLGLVILVVSIVSEQRRNARKMREEIDKEDLKP